MTIRGKITAHATQLTVDAAQAATTRAKGASAGYRGLRSVIGGEDVPITIENLLVALVTAVKADAHEDDRSARDVFTAARSRRRRLGLLSFGAGPLTGVATQIVDLYCDTAIVCDLVALHAIALTERQVAARILVLWGIVKSTSEAESVMSGASAQSVAAILGERVRNGTVDRVPDKIDKRAAIRALANARNLGESVRAVTDAGSVSGVIFSGHKTKQTIKRAEVALRLQPARVPTI
jgi:hypothetical protein